MFSRFWNFLKRHRKKFIFTGTVVCGGWLLYKYLQNKIKELRDKGDKDYITVARKQHHFDSNQRTCNMTVLSMLPNLRENVERTLNTEHFTALLKTNPSNKLQLWEELKILSFSRSIMAVYGCSIMALLLRVQLNIIGGYIYLDSLSKPDNHEEKPVHALAPQHVQQRYLSLVKYFLNQGLHVLSLYVQQVVSKEISSLPLKQGVSLTNIQSIVTNVRERVECGKNGLVSNISTLPLCQYMLPGEQVLESIEMGSEEDQLYNRLLNETRDVIESMDFHAVLQNCLERGFSSLIDRLAEHYKHQTTPTSHLHDVTIPLAKLVPIVDSLLYKLCSDAPNPLIQELLLLEDVKALSANIYEAFSEQDEKTQLTN